jgi:branched-chain amino acid transport system substrate-binding protein
MKLNHKGAVAVVVAAAFAIAGCGSSSKTSSPTTASTSGSTGTTASAAATPTGSPILIGNIGSYTGANDENGAGAGAVVQAWTEWVNANGGLNGHPVKLVVKDDAGSPSQALQDANQLVADHVIAIVGEDSIIPTAWTKVADKAGIPLIGGIPSDPFNFTDTNAFPIGVGAVTQLAGEFAYMKQAGLKKFAMLYCAEAPICASLGPLSKGIAGVVGGPSVAYTAEVAATAPTYTSQCLAMKNSGADAVEVASVPSVPPRVLTACSQLGVTPTQVTASETSNASWLSTPALANTVLISPVANYLDTSLPATAQFQSVVSQYIPGILKNPQFGQHSLLGWAAAQLFGAAAKAGHIGPTSTTQDVRNALYSLKNENLGGIVPTLNYTPDKPTLITCYFSYKISGGTYKSLNNNQTTCLDQATVSGVLKVLGG